MIQDACFIDASSSVAITLSDGSVWRDDATLPADNEIRRLLADWVAGGGVIKPYIPPAIDLVAYAADARWRKEGGGIVVAGIPVATDDRAKLMITGARVAAMADPAWTTTWHGTDGNSYPVDAAAMVAISDAVQAHVNATFATFAAVKAAIDAGEITTADQVDAAFGPIS